MNLRQGVLYSFPATAPINLACLFKDLKSLYLGVQRRQLCQVWRAGHVEQDALTHRVGLSFTCHSRCCAEDASDRLHHQGSLTRWAASQCFVSLCSAGDVVLFLTSSLLCLIVSLSVSISLSCSLSLCVSFPFPSHLVNNSNEVEE